MSDIKNLYNNLTNFYNVNDENFKEFMAKLYDEMLANHRDVKYVKEHYIEEIEKKLKEYIIDGKLNIKIDRNIYSELKKKANLNEVITKGNVDLNEMTERTLQAIQGGEGTSFELLSIPRNNSVNISKLDESVKNTLYRLMTFIPIPIFITENIFYCKRFSICIIQIFIYLRFNVIFTIDYFR